MLLLRRHAFEMWQRSKSFLVFFFFFPKVCFFLSAPVCRANPLAQTFTLHKLFLTPRFLAPAPSSPPPHPPPTLQSSQRGSRFQVSRCRCRCCCRLLCAGTHSSFPRSRNPPPFFPSPLLSSASHICLFCQTPPGGTLARLPAGTLRGSCSAWRTGEEHSWCERARPPKVSVHHHMSFPRDRVQALKTVLIIRHHVQPESQMFAASLVVEFLQAPPRLIFNDFVKLFRSLHDAKFEFWGTSL